MKIGLIVYGLDRPQTGLGRYTQEIARALRKIKEAPEIVLLTAGSLGPLAGEGFNCVPLPACRRLPALMTLGNLWISIKAKQLELEIVHDPSGVAPFLFGAGGAGTVVTLHDVFPWVCPETSTLLEQILYRHWLPHRIPHLQGVITSSNQSRNDIQKYLPVQENRLFTIPDGLSASFRRSVPAEAKHRLLRRLGLSTPFVLYVGALTARKNILRLLEAFALLRSEHRELQLVLAGPRIDLRTKVAKTVRRLNLTSSVICTGPIPDFELPALYASADLFVFPSLYEGFGLPPLEAMACGVPVVCSNTSSLPEVVGKAAIQVDPHDIEALARAMKSVIETPGLREELKAKGLVQSKRYSWERTAEATMAVYRWAQESKSR
jgi:glycosyltransferase involved in cell wall biosynthesis